MLERNSIYSQRSEVPKKLSTAEKYFVLLELEREPKTVDELPQSFTLPEEALGTFEAAILATSTDGRERSQHIYWEENWLLQRFPP